MSEIDHQIHKLLRSVAGMLIVISVAGRTLFPSEDAVTGSGLSLVLVELSCALFVLIDWGWSSGFSLFRWSSGFSLFRHAEACTPTPEKHRLDPICWVWAIFLSLLWISTLQAAFRFPAVILIWEWMGIAAVWLCMRRNSRPLGLQAIAVLIAALVLGQAGRACWQVGIEFPELQKRYQNADPLVHREIRQMGILPGSRLQRSFRDRLFGGEAMGSFGHPNSLAGFFLLGLPLVALAVLESWQRPGGWFGKGLTTLALLLVILALRLTRSRSALLAGVLAFGVLALFGVHGSRSVWQHRGKLCVAVVALTFFALVLWYFGLLDDLVASDTFASFRYRLEWWQASLGVLAEAPWFGVGLGSFGDHYLRYKLPYSSEEISDPHNFILELWCSAGVFVSIAYLALLFLALRNLLLRTPHDEKPQKLRLAPWWWMGSGLAYLLVSAIHSGSIWPGPLFFGYLGGFASLGLLYRQGLRISDRSLRLAIFVGVVGLHLHWLAAGGIFFPSLLLPCWVLLAAGAGEMGRQGDKVTRRRGDKETGRKVLPILWLILVTLAFFFIGVSFGRLLIPFLQREQILASVRNKQGTKTEQLLEVHRQAANLLPEDPSSWVGLARLHEARMHQEVTNPQAEYEAGVQCWKRAIALEPRCSVYYHALGVLHRKASKLDPKAADNAALEFRRMVQYYPNSAAGHWELGRALMATGQIDEAKQEFERSLDLDEKMPHLDRKLREDWRYFAQRILGR